MKIIKALLFVLSCTCSVYAQPDHLITVSGDTLQGEIDILLPTDYFEEINFKGDQGKRRYKAFQFVGFQKDGEFYKSIKHSNKYRIMKEVAGGYLGLYLYRSDNSFEFGSRFLYKISNEGLEVPNINFKKAVSKFVSDCPSVEAQVLDRTYKASNLVDMVAAFNDCLNRQPLVQRVIEEGPYEPVVIVETEELRLINAISEKLKTESISDELSTLLKDITSKIEKGEKVPGYLQSALKEETQEHKSVQQEVNDLLTALK